MINKEFYKDIEIISEVKGLPKELLFEGFRKALLNGFKKKYCHTSARVEFKPEKNEIFMYSQHLVVEEYQELEECEYQQMLLSDAKAISSRYKVGDIVEQSINIKEFTRVESNTCKQVFIQQIKIFEKEKAYNYFKSMENEMIVAEIIDIKKDEFLTLSIGENVTTLLPVKELLPNDNFEIGDKINVYITMVEQGTKGPKVFVSRNTRDLVTRLLELHIPELSDGVVEIMGLARDAGDRTKIAVYSHLPQVDPIGACVGENGLRIKEVVDALNGEKIDLYRWSSDPYELITNALQPSEVIKVINLNQKDKSAIAIVPDNQLSLAIGKSGQNVRLAVLSSGWKIDIKSVSQAVSEGVKF